MEEGPWRQEPEASTLLFLLGSASGCGNNDNEIREGGRSSGNSSVGGSSGGCGNGDDRIQGGSSGFDGFCGGAAALKGRRHTTVARRGGGA
ncbi:hypothetical protein E2562_005239 [Oryza meyeriana var. granulata]|uniref:Uncharacterized protein n=1 Tax=Oryza meyeriana var. granulata TaxID=110450 RepID=A0A6G1EET1_9ORYZ|nr:hypothetical protein E2562_005239 [Oryza meyeriana var. granulata]